MQIRAKEGSSENSHAGLYEAGNPHYTKTKIDEVYGGDIFVLFKIYCLSPS